jgi:hypothetical protein
VQEVLPRVFHWAARHPQIHIEVSSYWLEQDGVLFDPLEPPVEGVEWFAGRTAEPAAVLLSNRHHYRHAGRFADRYGCPVLCNREGLHEFARVAEVDGFCAGDELPGGVLSHEMGSICPDDTALVVPRCRAVVLADGVVRGGPHGQGGPLGFVPDSLMDDPPQTKRGLLHACERLLDEVEFDHLLLAHGGPVVGDGRTQLEDLVQAGGRTAFEM